MDFSNIRFDDSGPIYLQVVRFFKKKILLGELKHGDELPSRRILSAALGLNLTTIQKIYKQMEDEKLIDTLPNSKTTVCLTDERLKEIERELIHSEIKKFTDELKSCNVKKVEALVLVDRIWEEENTDL